MVFRVMAISFIQRILWNGRHIGGGVGTGSLRGRCAMASGRDRGVREVLAVFGRAEVVRLEDGGHALLGGTPNDRTQAREWISLFGHDVVC